MGRQRKKDKFATVTPNQASQVLLQPLVYNTVFMNLSIAAELTPIHFITFALSPLS